MPLGDTAGPRSSPRRVPEIYWRQPLCLDPDLIRRPGRAQAASAGGVRAAAGDAPLVQCPGRISVPRSRSTNTAGRGCEEAAVEPAASDAVNNCLPDGGERVRVCKWRRAV